jgi:ketosteroid isomerase-like protein
MFGCGSDTVENGQATVGDRDLIRAMHDDRTSHYNQSDIVALMETYAEEATVLTGTLQVASGKDAIRDLIGTEMERSQGLNNELKEVLLFDDQAVLWGSYVWSGVGSEETSGPYMLELGKFDGSWKVTREMWSHDQNPGEGLTWDNIPEDFDENSEWSDEMNILENLYNSGNPAALAELFSGDALVGIPNFPVLEGREIIQEFFQSAIDKSDGTVMDVLVRSANVLNKNNVMLAGYIEVDGESTEGRARFLLLLELANSFEVDAGEDAEWQVRWMVASGKELFSV